MNVVSFGVGQNSTAMIILMYNQNIKIDEIIFADVGNESPETYAWLPIFKKWMKKKGLKFTTVRSHLGTLREDYFKNKIIPFRAFRSCTDKFKIQPIRKYLKSAYPDCKHFNMYLGIASDEKHRAKESRRKYQTMFYPLIEKNVDRKGCVKIIEDEKVPVPPKSGCVFCPFQPKRGWKNLLKNHPDIFDECIEFEENCRAFPKYYLTYMPLRKIKKGEKEQTKLKDFSVEQCVYCHT